jgi:hypothetical protein
MAVTKKDLEKMETNMKNFFREINTTSKNEIMSEIRNLQDSLADMDITVKENKDNLTLLEARVLALETQEIGKKEEIEKLTNEINDAEQHQRNFSVRIQGLAVPKDLKGESFLNHIYEKAIKPALDFAKIKGELDTVPERDKVIEYGHVLPSKKPRSGPPIIIVRFMSRVYLMKVLHFSYPALNPFDASDHGWVIPPEYNLLDPGQGVQQLSKIQINGDLTYQNAKLLKTLRDKAKMKDGITKAWRSYNGKIKYTLNNHAKDTKVVNSLFQEI